MAKLYSMEIHHAVLDRTVSIKPPLLNSANPWATTYSDLKNLYFCPSTGGVTTRTCLLTGFGHDERIHQYTFVDPVTLCAKASSDAQDQACGSLNTLGYSPRTLEDYLNDITLISQDWETKAQHPGNGALKPVIISVTGSPQEVRQCWDQISQKQMEAKIPLLMEVNLSCPNITGKPPPAYSPPSLQEYLTHLSGKGVPIGLKVPPYTYYDQFKGLIDTIQSASDTCQVSFITAVNTLGSSLVLQDYEQEGSALSYTPAINSSTGVGIGGLAGAPLHPLALGNVKILSGLIKADPSISHIKVIGVGGVSDVAGYKRMKTVGASAVAIGTALGAKGIDVFREIVEALEMA